jgi:peptidoglycan hydrolase-like protein with peptidoglycan-binding domain
VNYRAIHITAICAVALLALPSFSSAQSPLVTLHAIVPTGAASTTSVVSSNSCVTLTRNLSLGSRGADVTKLQQFLAWEYSNFYPSYVTGYFGPTTQAAVKQWQREHNIVSSGSPWTTGWGAVGPKTRAAIAAACGATHVNGANPGQSSSTPNVGTQTSTSSNTTASSAPSSPATTTSPRLSGGGGGGGGSGGGGGGGSGGGGGGPPTQPTNCTWNGRTVQSGQSITAYQSSTVPYGQSCVSQARTCLNGALSGDPSYHYPSCTPTSPPNNGSVTVQGDQFFVNGAPLKLKGVQFSGSVGVYEPSETGGVFSPTTWDPNLVDAELTYLSETMGVNVIRVWSFFGAVDHVVSGQPDEVWGHDWTDNQGNLIYDPSGQSNIDRLGTLLDLAQKHHIYVMVDLFEGTPGLSTCPWVDCPPPYGDSIHSDALLPAPGDPAEAYQKKYIDEIVGRFKNHSAVLDWQIMEEIEGGLTDAQYTRSLSWLKRMRDYIKSIDSNHLVATEFQHYYTPFKQVPDTDNLNGGQPLIGEQLTDFVQWSDYDDTIASDIAYVKAHTGKPVVVGEFGAQVADEAPSACPDNPTGASQNQKAQMELQAIVSSGIAGGLWWDPFETANFRAQRCDYHFLRLEGPFTVAWTNESGWWQITSGYGYMSMYPAANTFRKFFSGAGYPQPVQQDAQYAGDTIPRTLAPGTQYTATISFQNTGAGTWYTLGGFFVQQAWSTTQTWLHDPFLLSDNTQRVAPGQTGAFALFFVAPSAPGTYTLQFQMEQLGGIGPFGSQSPAIQVTVPGNGPTAQNLLVYSEQFDNPAWLPYCNAPAITANTTDVAAPDGTNHAAKLVSNSALGCGGVADGIYQSVAGGLTLGQPYTVSIWLRGASGGETGDIGVNDVNAGRSVTLTTSWQRYTSSVSSLTSDPSRGFQLRLMSPSETVYAWGAQLEAHPAAGPYTPTTAVLISSASANLASALTALAFALKALGVLFHL